MEQCSVFFQRDYFKRDKGLNFIKHTKVIELKVEQLTLLDNGIFTENICTFDEKKSEKGLDTIGNTSSGHTRVTKLKYEN